MLLGLDHSRAPRDPQQTKENRKLVFKQHTTNFSQYSTSKVEPIAKNNMADDLDALFGAFDGDGEVDSSSNPNDEKKKAEDAETQRKTDDDAPMEDPSAEKSESPPKSAAAASTYTSVMSKHLASHWRDDAATSKSHAQDQVALAKKAALAQAGLIKEEIATGTSHDKSVRSYSAYPKNLPPELEQLQKEKAAKAKDNSDKKEPAKTYPFPLDPFQQQAIGYIDNDESVLVAAHTSAGKTVAAEYAIAKSLKAGQVSSSFGI